LQYACQEKRPCPAVLKKNLNYLIYHYKTKLADGFRLDAIAKNLLGVKKMQPVMK
jgi:hypothetical protein